MTREFLEQRNALWGELRQLEPSDPRVEALLAALGEMIGWSRARIFAGLGWGLEEAADVAQLETADVAQLENL